MKETKKTYWKGLEQLTNDPEFVKYADKEFAEKLPLPGEQSGNSRRDFLKVMGFSVAAATLAACEAPVRKAIPYVNKPEDVDPGVPNYYASTYDTGGNYCSIVVKTREGRPIKIEGNDRSHITKGGTTAQVEASVLSLYDDTRYRGPKKDDKYISWEELDEEVMGGLASGKTYIVSRTIMSPTTKAVIKDFKAKYPNTQHVSYDTQTATGILQANEESFGKKAIPSYDFSKADTIVSFGADFLGTWLSPVEYTKQYAQTRKIGPNKKKMSRHFQFESNLSLTGANADYRTPIKPSQLGSAVIALYNEIAKKAGAAGVSGGETMKNIAMAADELWKNRSRSLVVSGSNDPSIQVLINAINDLLNNYGATIDIENHSNYRMGDDKAMNGFIADADSGKIKNIIFLDCNPVYDHPGGARLKAALQKVAMSVSTSDRPDETAAASKLVAPNHHFLESWGDSEPKNGHLSLTQPSIRPLFKTRQAQESLLKWAGNDTEYYSYMRDRWMQYYTGAFEEVGYQMFLDKCLHDGFYHVEKAEENEATVSSFAGDISAAAAEVNRNYKGSGIELSLYFKVANGDGTMANNPWLQEMPDPITKTTWDNYLTISQSHANELGIKKVEGKTNKIKLTSNGTSYELPVVIQPGQAKGTVGLALGYGREVSGKVGKGLGKNAYPLTSTINGTICYDVLSGVTLEVLPEKYQVAQTQTHETYMGRDFVIQETTLGAYQKDPGAGRYYPKISSWKSPDGHVAPGKISLWKGHEYPNHHWGLMIDMNSCTGCGACTIACQAENNVPVVGRQEVINRREMHWIRIDRYYSSDGDPEDNAALEIAAENPEVTFQPMMCQHCNNAPCETVCPVAATTHSTEGLNQMAYNRCIGTRYCANNCPYKVRRFNWFKYHDNKQFSDSNTMMNSDLGKMVLNPDVTVRSRGVMEKCSFCVQRLQYGKLEAKKEGRRPKDEDIVTACASSCPADALVFGDLNDQNSKISKMLKIKSDSVSMDKEIGEERAYAVLEEVGTKPNVLYLTKVRNKEA